MSAAEWPPSPEEPRVVGRLPAAGGQVLLVEVAGDLREAFVTRLADGGCRVLLDGQAIDLPAGPAWRRAALTPAGRRRSGEAEHAELAEGPGQVRSPVSGTVTEACARPGSAVAAGERLVVVEAMKVRYEICAELAGTLEQVAVPGTRIRRGEIIARLTVKPPSTMV